MSDTKGDLMKGGVALTGSTTLTTSQTQYTNFLFGENLEERVLLPAKEEPQTSDSKKEETEHCGDGDGGSGESSATTKLPEKRKYEVITGEEDESNVLQIFCKLYLWDSKLAFWKEKGKGMLRLNDKMKDDKMCSRLVMRTGGSLKVILNASIVSGMKFELSNENCLRFINIDGIYLFKGKEKDIEQLNSAIECRLRELSKKVKVDDSDDKSEDTVNEPSEESANSKASEDSAEDSKEELRQPDIDGSHLKSEFTEKNGHLEEENSRKENEPEDENKSSEKKDDSEEDKQQQSQSQSNPKTETTSTTNTTEDTPSSPPPTTPALDQK